VHDRICFEPREGLFLLTPVLLHLRTVQVTNNPENDGCINAVLLV
jgi:hypothetical protein